MNFTSGILSSKTLVSIFPTVKPALLLLFYIPIIADQILYQDPVLLFCKLVLALKIEFNCNVS